MNTVKARGARHGWAAQRRAVTGAVTDKVKDCVKMRLKNDMTRECNAWINELRSIYESQIRTVKDKQRAGTLTLKDTKTLAEIIELTDRGGRRALGLDQPASTTNNTFIQIVTGESLAAGASTEAAAREAGDTVIDVSNEEE